jgi:hypothetical protein
VNGSIQEIVAGVTEEAARIEGLLEAQEEIAKLYG